MLFPGAEITAAGDATTDRFEVEFGCVGWGKIAGWILCMEVEAMLGSGEEQQPTVVVTGVSIGDAGSPVGVGRFCCWCW